MQTIYVIIGPTASGKSDKAVELALAHGGEVISADSRQVYQGLDIATGKITTEEMQGVRHHLLSYVGGGSIYSVARWVSDARAAIDDITSRGKVPIICGGTGMYIYSLIYGLDHDVAPDYKLREELNKLETEELYNKYKEINGTPTDNSISNNRPRLIRAIELSVHNKHINNTDQANDVYKNRQPLYDVQYIRMERTRDELCERIARRADIRLDAMIEETERLLSEGVDPNWLSRVGIEYREIMKYLDGQVDIQTMRDNIVLRSLQYAKRQNTWNKKYFQA